MSDDEEGSYYEEVEEVLDDDEYEVVEEEVTEREIAEEEVTEQEFTEVSVQDSSIHEVSPEEEAAAKRAALIKREQELKAKLAILQQQQADSKRVQEEVEAPQPEPQQEASAVMAPSQPPEAAPEPAPKIEDASIVAPPGAIELPPGPLGVIFQGPNPTILKTITANSAVKDRLRVGMVIERMIVVGQKDFVGLGPIDLSNALKAYSGPEYTRCFVIQSLGATRASQKAAVASPLPQVSAPSQSTQRGNPTIVPPPGAIKLPHGPLGVIFRGPNPTVVKKIGDSSTVKGLLRVGDIVEKLVIDGVKEFAGLAPIELSSVLKSYSDSQYTRYLVIERSTPPVPKARNASIMAPEGSIALPAGPLQVVFSGPGPTVKKIADTSSVKGLLHVGDVVEKLVVVGEEEMSGLSPTELTTALKSYSGQEYTRCLVIKSSSPATSADPSIVAPEGSVVLPPGLLGISFNGKTPTVKKIADESPVQGILQVGDVVEKLVVVGEEEMSGMSPTELGSALKKYSGPQYTRCLVLKEVSVPEGSIVLPSGKLGVTFQGPPTTISKIAEGSSVQGVLQVGDVVEKLIINGGEEMSGLSPVELSNALKSYSGQEYTRCLVIKSASPATSADPSIVAPEGSVVLPPGLLGISFNGQTPTVKKIADESPVQGILQVGDVVEKLVVVGEEEMSGMSPTELGSALKKYSGPQYTRCLVLKEVSVPEGSIVLPPGPLGVVFSGPTPTIKKIGENSSVKGLLQLGDVVEKLVVVGHTELTGMTPTELSDVLRSFSGPEYTRCLFLAGSEVGSSSPVEAAPIPSLEGTLPLPLGALGVVFTGTPPTVKQIKPSSPVKGLLNVGDEIEELILVGRKPVSGMSSTALTQALKACSGSEYSRFLVVKHASKTSQRSIQTTSSVEPEADAVFQDFSEDLEEVVEDESAGKGITGGEESVEESDGDFSEEEEDSREEANPEGADGDFSEEEEEVEEKDYREAAPPEWADNDTQELEPDVQEEEAPSQLAEKAAKKAEKEAALKVKLQAEIAALEAQMEQKKIAEQEATRHKESELAAKREQEAAAEKQKEAEQAKAAAAERERKEKAAAKERQFQESLQRQQEREGAAASALQPDKEFYSIEELKSMSVPGLDYANKEKYLTDKDFQGIFGMSKDEFATLPKWKRINTKKQHGLF